MGTACDSCELILKNGSIISASKSAFDFFSCSVVGTTFEQHLSQSGLQEFNSHLSKLTTDNSVTFSLTLSNNSIEKQVDACASMLLPESEGLILLRLSNVDILKGFEINTGQCLLVLSRTDDDMSILGWRIDYASGNVFNVINVENQNCIGHTLSEYIKSNVLILVPNIVDESLLKMRIFDAKNLGRMLRICIRGCADGRIIIKISDITEIAEMKSQLQKTITINRAVNTIVSIVSQSGYTDDSLTPATISLCEGLHLKRFVVYVRIKDKSVIKYQYAAPQINKYDEEQCIINHIENTEFDEIFANYPYISGPRDYKMMPKTRKLFGITNKMVNHYAFPIYDATKETQFNGYLLIETNSTYNVKSLDIENMMVLANILSCYITQQRNQFFLTQARTRAEDADRLKATLLRNMNNDLLLPIRSIIGYSNMLADPDITQSEREEFCDMIVSSGTQFMSTIDNVIKISELETKQLFFKKEKCNLYQQIEGVIKLYKNNEKVLSGQIDIVCDLPTIFNDIIVETDTYNFRIVLRQLIDNAIKFSDKGVVKIGLCDIRENKVELFVQDSGIGIPAEMHNTIFAPFGKVERHNYTEAGEGAGLGLTLSQMIVEQLGGKIHVLSKPNKGSVFFINFPISTNYTDTILERMKQLCSNYQWQNRTIVHVTADDIDAHHIEKMVRFTNINYVWLKNGNELLHYLSNNENADLVMVDFYQKSDTAIEVIEQLNGLSNLPPMVTYSHFDLKEEVQNILNAGFSDFLRVPLNGVDILNFIESKINQSTN